MTLNNTRGGKKRTKTKSHFFCLSFNENSFRTPTKSCASLNIIFMWTIYIKRKILYAPINLNKHNFAYSFCCCWCCRKPSESTDIILQNHIQIMIFEQSTKELKDKTIFPSHWLCECSSTEIFFPSIFFASLFCFFKLRVSNDVIQTYQFNHRTLNALFMYSFCSL